jgi:hypothetical protein
LKIEIMESEKIASLKPIDFYRRSLCIILLIFFLFSVPGAVLAQGKVRCEICGKTAWGKYWTYDDKSFCDDCYKKYPHCYTCGLPTENFITLDNEKFCRSCYSNRLPRCAGCGCPVFKCWVKKDKYGNSLRYCKDCLIQISDKCNLCGTALTGKYWVMRSSIVEGSRKYCEQCRNKGKKCFYCGLLASGNTKADYEGRIVCQSCKSELITRSSDYYPIFEDVRRSFAKLGLQVNSAPILNIVGYKKLKKLGENVGYSKGDKWGLYKCTKIISGFNQNRVIILKNSDIYVLSQLPGDLAFYVMSHEYAHAWYEERVARSKGPVIDEGFAEWVSYHVLKDHGKNYLAESLKGKDDIYGEGLRKLLEIERKRGFNAVLEYVLK